MTNVTSRNGNKTVRKSVTPSMDKIPFGERVWRLLNKYTWTPQIIIVTIIILSAWSCSAVWPVK